MSIDEYTVEAAEAVNEIDNNDLTPVENTESSNVENTKTANKKSNDFLKHLKKNWILYTFLIIRSIKLA